MATAKSWALFSFSLARRNVIYKAKRKLSVILGYFETNCYAGYNENEKKSFCFRGPYRGIPVMCDWLILFSVKREFNKLFFVIRDLKVLRDP